MQPVKTLLTKGLRDSAGSVLPIAAIAMLVATVIVGSAVDISRAYRAKNRLQSACDAAVLAGRHAVTTNGFDSTAQTAATNYFNVNFNDDDQDTSDTTFTPSSDDEGVTVNGTVTTTLSTLIMRLFGFDTFSLSATCSASMGMGNADVMFVLDTTGSMNEDLDDSTRIEALRDAMNNFYTTVSTATSGTNARVRYGFVPFAMTVNVGNLIYAIDPDYLVDSHTYQSREYVVSDTSTSYSSVSSSDWSKYSDTSYSSSTTCASALPTDDTDYSDYGDADEEDETSSGVTTTTASQDQRKYYYKCVESTTGKNKNKTTVYYIYAMYYYRTKYTETTSNYSYHPISYDTSVYKKGGMVTTPTGSEGASVSSTWNGCIEERATVASSTFSYSSVSGMSPSGAYDIDIDTAPDADDDDTKWVPMWLDVTYRRKSSSKSGSYTYKSPTVFGDHPTTDNCSTESKLLTEMDEDSFSEYVDSLTPSGNTYLDIGMIWGGRLLSPDGIFSDNVNTEPKNGGEVSRHLVFMTDGDMNTSTTSLSAWGLEFWDRRVTDDGETDGDARHTARLLAVCEAIRAKGIRLWVIAFTTSLNSDLTTCASDDSSFTADDADELNSAFQEIANEVGELRVTS